MTRQEHRQTERRIQPYLLAALSTIAVSMIAVGYLYIGLPLIHPVPGHLPEVSLSSETNPVTTLPPHAVEVHDAGVVNLYTMSDDWASFKNILANDVARHGGWSQYHRDSVTHYYVPASYIPRIQPLLDSHREKPHSTTYVAWANMAMAETGQPMDENQTADTRISIKHSSPAGDTLLLRIAVIGLLSIAGLATAAMLGTLFFATATYPSSQQASRQADA